MVRSRAWRRAVRVHAVGHRWVALVLGVLLVLEVGTGVVLLFRPEVYRLLHPGFFAGTPSAHPLSPEQALAALRAQRPAAHPEVVTPLDSVYQLEQDDYTHQFYLDAGTGRLLGEGSYGDGALGWMVNLHDCLLACPGYSGYLPIMATRVPGLPRGVAGLLLGVVGLAFLWLVGSGLVAWWPGVRRFARGWRIHRHLGSYRYHRDLHDVLGVIAVPALLVWALTGAGYELPFVADVWFAVTGSAGPPATALASRPGPGPDLTPDRAVTAARAALPEGRLVSVALPEAADPTSTYRLFYHLGPPADGYGGIRAFGDTTVAVDRRDPARTAVTSGGHTDLGERLWSKWSFGVHFGYAVPWGWRLLWLGFGALPLVLAYTGLRTWLARRRRAVTSARRTRGAPGSPPWPAAGPPRRPRSRPRTR